MQGSSPRVRGADDAVNLKARYYGIIPARAGSSNITNTNTIEWRDHPRACGEQDSWADDEGFVEGSSPRVRGAARLYDVRFICHGIIPARAGSSLHHPAHRGSMWDHPRACGEQRQR